MAALPWCLRINLPRERSVSTDDEDEDEKAPGMRYATGVSEFLAYSPHLIKWEVVRAKTSMHQVLDLHGIPYIPVPHPLIDDRLSAYGRAVKHCR